MTEETKQTETAAEAIVDEDAEAQLVWDKLEAEDAGIEPAIDSGQEDPPTVEEPAAPEGDAMTGAEAPEDPDIWAEAPEKLRAAFEDARGRAEKFENQIKSTTGRESTLQIKLNDLQSQLDAALKKDANGEQEGNSTANEFFESDQWKTFEDEFAEVAGPVKSMIDNQLAPVKALEQRIDGISAKQGDIDKNANDTVLQQNLDTLKGAHGDWDAVTDSQEFTDWLNEQPRYVKEAALRNGEHVVDAAEAIDMIQRFKDQTSYVAKPENPDEGDKPKPQADKRTLQLESSSAPRTKGQPPVTTGVPDDPEAAWKYFDEQDRKAEAQGN